MGYMGFGMRKEDYNRKPRELFGKRKLYQNLHAPSADETPGKPTETGLEKYRDMKKFMHFHETMLFKFFYLMLLTGFIIILGFIVSKFF